MFRITVFLVSTASLFTTAVFAYTDEDLFPLTLPEDIGETTDTEDTKPVYDERYDPELWYVTLVKLWEMYETVPSGKVLQASFDATKGMDYVVIIRGKGIKSFLRTPFDTSLYTPLNDPLIEGKILEEIGGDEAIYNYLHNAKENGEYSVRVESRSNDRENVEIEVFVVHKSRRIRIEEEEETEEIEETETVTPEAPELTIEGVED